VVYQIKKKMLRRTIKFAWLAGWACMAARRRDRSGAGLRGALPVE
jgi:hypothetical protein